MNRIVGIAREALAAPKVSSALAVALTLMFIAPLQADSAGRQHSNPRFHRVERAGSSIQRAHRRLESGRVTTSAVIDNAPTVGVVIPAAGNAPGGFGTYFRSDVTFANMRDIDQMVVITWLPNGMPDGAIDFRGSIPSGVPVTYRDFVGSELELTGVGALVILPVNGADEIDADAEIDASSRIWSPSPDGGAGTFSQPFPGMDMFHMLDWSDALMLGLRQDEGFRTNYGIVNMSEFAQRFYVSVLDDEGALVAQAEALLSPGEMILKSLPVGRFGNISVVVSVDEVFASSSLVWTAFASSTDNATGDGWVSLPGRVTRAWVRDQLP